MTDVLRRVEDVEIGDRIYWCGRSVLVVDQKPARSRFRPDRYLIVEIDLPAGRVDRQLHYYDDEAIRVVP